MKELKSFPENQVMWKSFSVGQKKTDSALDALVTHAKKFKRIKETDEPQNHIYPFNSKKVINGPEKFQKKQFDVRNSLQLQYFNVAPTYVTRKRKPECNSNPFDSSHLAPIQFTKSQENTSNQLNSIDEKPTFAEKKCTDNSMVAKKNKATMVSPIPAFITEPQKELLRSVDPSLAPTVPTEASAIELLKNLTKVQKLEGDQHDNYSAEGGEEPVKNSMFWLYRSFPHIN